MSPSSRSPVSARAGFVPCLEDDELTPEQCSQLFKGSAQAFIHHLYDLAVAQGGSSDTALDERPRRPSERQPQHRTQQEPIRHARRSA